MKIPEMTITAPSGLVASPIPSRTETGVEPLARTFDAVNRTT